MHEENGAKNQFCLSDLEVNSSDIVRVYDAFANCESPKLLDALLSMESNWHTNTMLLSDTARVTLLRRIDANLEVMRYLSPSITVSDKLIVPWQCFELLDYNGTLQRRMGAAVLNLSKIPQANYVINQYGSAKSINAFMQTMVEHDGENPVDELWASGIAFDASELRDTSWSNVLAMHIWLPQTLTERELYFTLGHLFWSITYDGFNNSMSSLEDAIDIPYAKPTGIPVSFYDDYDLKMSHFTELLNYSIWSEVVVAAESLCKSA